LKQRRLPLGIWRLSGHGCAGEPFGRIHHASIVMRIGAIDPFDPP
jgi:hypothetical protein